MTADVLVERRDRVAVITVSDPARRNALTGELSDRLARVVGECDADESVGALVVTGAPPAFCAGGDLAALGEAGRSGSHEGLVAIYEGFLTVARASVPTVAAVTGPAVGAGLNLALACDVRLAGPGAVFDARFLQLGIHPGGGMTWMAQRLLGPQAAAAMALFGESFDAAEALRVGLVHRVVDVPGDDPRSPAAHAALVDAAVAFAARASRAPRDLVSATKTTLRDTAALPRHGDAVDREVTPQMTSLASEAFRRTLAEIEAARRR